MYSQSESYKIRSAKPEFNSSTAKKVTYLFGLPLAKSPAAGPEEPLVSDDEPIDKQIDLASAVHVLDADSSQATCIEEVRQGRSLVIQGPPGTGIASSAQELSAAGREA